MKINKPQWNLLVYVLPPIFSSLVLLIFFPLYLLPLLIAIIIFALLLSCLVGIKNFSNSPIDQRNLIAITGDLSSQKGLLQMRAGEVAESVRKNKYRWFFSLFGLIFLLGMSAVFFIFLTAASQLSPEQLNFGDVVTTWHITFLGGICFLFAQLITTFIQNKKSTENSLVLPSFFKKIKNEEIEKTKVSNQIFLHLSALLALVVSLSVIILTIANGFARWLGFEVPMGMQLQTVIGSTLIYLPFATKYWKDRRFLKVTQSRGYRFFKLIVGLVIAIVLSSFLTIPMSGAIVPLQFLGSGLLTLQWELLILVWWIGITPLVVRQIMALCKEQSLLPIISALIIISGSTYWVCTEFLLHGGEAYFLAVIRQGIPALILTALPIAGLILNILPFHYGLPIRATRFLQEKLDRREQYLTHSLIQATVIACVLYWVSGLSFLFILLLIVALPRLMMFLLVELGWLLGSRS